MRDRGASERCWRLGVALALALGLTLGVGLPAGADISLAGSQHAGDDDNADLTGTFEPSDPVLFDRMTAYPTHFHLTEEVTVAKVRFQGLAKERAAGRPYVAIDGTDYAGTWDDGTDTLTLDSPPTLAAGLHTLAVTSDCINSNTYNIVPCSGGGNKTEHDLAFSGLTLVTQTGAASVSRHWVRRRHAGSTDDADDDYDDLGDSNQEPFFYPDGGEGSPISVSFSLGSDTYFDALWMFRLREVTGNGGDLTLRLDGTEVWSDTISGDSPDMQDSPAAFPIDQTLEAGDYTLEIAAHEDFSWDSIILKAPGPGGGDVGLGDFNAFESSTKPDPGAVDGPLYTKVSGLNFQVDIVHLNNGGNPQVFNGEVDLELVDATSGPDCESLESLTDLKTGVTFSNEKRINVSGLKYADAIGSARVRVTEVNPGSSPGGGPPGADPEQGCSQDTFTVRPHHLTVEAWHNDWETAGDKCRLDGNNSTTCRRTCPPSGSSSGEPCHKAGRDFTLQGWAEDAAGNAVSGFSETGYLGWNLVSPSGGTSETGEPSSLDFVEDGSGRSGFSTNLATYDEVGVLKLTLTDQGHFAADSGDKTEDHCVTGSSSNTENGSGQYGCQSATTKPAKKAGRFVPDHFRVTDNDPAFRDATSPWSSPFTYMGQSFTYATGLEPAITVEAVNTDGATTQNYGGQDTTEDFWKLANPARAYTDATSGIAASFVADQGPGAVTWDVGGSDSRGDYDGQATLTISEDEFRYDRTGTRQPPFDALVDLTLAKTELTDGDSVCYDSNDDGTCENFVVDADSGKGSQQAIGGTQLRYGRLVVGNAHGPETGELEVPLRAEYWAGDRFAVNGADGSTGLTVAADAGYVPVDLRGDSGGWQDATGSVNLIGGRGSGNTTGQQGFLAGGSGPSSPNTLTGGTARLVLDAPGAGNTGYVDVRGQVLANFPWLGFDWDDADNDGNPVTNMDNPAGRATFGRYRGNDRILFWREVYH